MEKRLLNLYLKHIKDTDKKAFKKVTSLPVHIKFQFVAILFFLTLTFVSVILSQSEFKCIVDMDLWKTIWTLIYWGSVGFSLVMCAISNISVNKYEIDISDGSMKEYWDFCNSTKDWMVNELIPECEDEEVILSEIKELKVRIDNYRNEMIAMTEKREERIDKWIQALAVPFVLAIITAIIDKNDNLGNAIAIAFSIALIGAMIFSAVWLSNNFRGLLRKQKTEQLKFFSDDLQGILDCHRYSKYIKNKK